MSNIFLKPGEYSESYPPVENVLKNKLTEFNNLKAIDCASAGGNALIYTDEKKFKASFFGLFSAGYQEKHTHVLLDYSVYKNFDCDIKNVSPDSIKKGYGFYVMLTIDSKDFNFEGIQELSVSATSDKLKIKVEICYIGLQHSRFEESKKILNKSLTGGSSGLPHLLVGVEELTEVLNSITVDRPENAEGITLEIIGVSVKDD